MESAAAGKYLETDLAKTPPECGERLGPAVIRQRVSKPPSGRRLEDVGNGTGTGDAGEGLGASCCRADNLPGRGLREGFDYQVSIGPDVAGSPVLE
jgi:hypothetical protein